MALHSYHLFSCDVARISTLEWLCALYDLEDAMLCPCIEFPLWQASTEWLAQIRVLGALLTMKMEAT